MAFSHLYYIHLLYIKLISSFNATKINLHIFFHYYNLIIQYMNTQNTPEKG